MEKCAGLVSYGATATPDGAASTGLRACRICTTAEAKPGAPGGAFVAYVPGRSLVPGLYRARVSARTPLPPSTPAPDFAFKVLVFQGAGIIAERPQAPAPLVASDRYQTYEREVEVTSAALPDRIELHVSVSSKPGECLVVDDLVLTRE